MRKKTLIIFFSWLMVLSTMAIIYIFSEENAEKSAQTSSGVIKDVLDVFLPEEDITQEVIKKYQLPFRKVAHFGIFMLLGFCFANAYCNTIRIKSIFNYLISFGSTALYAMFDEAHQNFSKGRGPSPMDVFIDSFGGLVGIASFAIFIYFYNRIINKKSVIDGFF